MGVTLSLSVAVFAEETFLPEIDSWLVVNEEGPANSDDIILKVTLLNKKRTSEIKFPVIIGPIYFSGVNKQIFSCESNAIKATREANAFDLKGNRVFSFKHLGFIRNCGITEDKMTYWLHYNYVRDKKPINIVVALSAKGDVLYKESFSKEKTVFFSNNNKTYKMSFPDAEWPG